MAIHIIHQNQNKNVLIRAVFWLQSVTQRELG